MDGFFSKKAIVIILLAVLLCLMLGIMSAVSGGRVSPIGSLVNMLTTPIQSAITGISDKFSDMSSRMEENDRLAQENAELRSELALLKNALRENESMGKENAQLRAALGMRERDSSFVFEAAEIVAKSSDNWASSFTINKGSSSGIAPDNCVITEDGMVGYIGEVGKTWATVIAITDTTMEASAIASRTRDVASAEGDFELMKNGHLRLSYLPRDTQIIKGDVIETSGVGGLFPKGIMLGTVVEVRTDTHGISKYAVIEPAVDLDHINHVLVIKSFSVSE